MMKLESSNVEDQMASSSSYSPFCYIKWVAVVVVGSLTFGGFIWGFGLLLSSVILITSIVLILSTVLIFTLFTEQKVPQKSVTEEEVLIIKSNDHHDHQEIIEDVVPTVLLLQQQQQQQQHKEDQQLQKCLETDHQALVLLHDYSSSPDLLSESESIDDPLSISEDSEVDWPFRDIVYQSLDCSDDGSISDEESLIEIALPSGHYVDHDQNKLNHIQHKVVVGADHHFLRHESILKQHSLMDLLAELNDVNEEDNLIEIDISMGSIKCSRFEIEA